jgi:hypothetical protein
MSAARALAERSRGPAKIFQTVARVTVDTGPTGAVSEAPFAASALPSRKKIHHPKMAAGMPTYARQLAARTSWWEEGCVRATTHRRRRLRSIT